MINDPWMQLSRSRQVFGYHTIWCRSWCVRLHADCHQGGPQTCADTDQTVGRYHEGSEGIDLVTNERVMSRRPSNSKNPSSWPSIRSRFRTSCCQWWPSDSWWPRIASPPTRSSRCCRRGKLFEFNRFLYIYLYVKWWELFRTLIP